MKKLTVMLLVMTRRRTKLWNVSGDTAGSCEGPVFGGRPEKAG